MGWSQGRDAKKKGGRKGKKKDPGTKAMGVGWGKMIECRRWG